MHTGNSNSGYIGRVHGTEILLTDTRQQYREKIARITLDSMVQFVGLLDVQGTVLEINKVALDAVGINLADVEGKPFWATFWWQVSTEINETLINSIARAAKGEFVRWDTEIYGRAGGTETIVIDASLCPVVDEQGRVVFIAAEGRDISAKKAYEQEIARKNADLQSLLTRISELDEIKTQFFANVSHELRTPLALIIGPAERLVNANPVLSAAEQKDTAQVIVRNARMLLKHVNDLLDISKLEAGKLKIELQETDTASLVRFIASHFDILAGERQISFGIYTDAACIAAVDPEKLQRVVMNLLSNAFKFVPVGGTVNCSLQSTGKELLLSVEDSGPGIPATMRKIIFERFRQGDGGTNRQFAGTGLGLAIAQEFVEMHKGSIEVLDSGLGGALFRVVIPVVQPVGSLQQSLAPVASSLYEAVLAGLVEELRLPLLSKPVPDNIEGPAKKTSVLVVEDNHDMNKFIAECLGREYRIITAFDGKQGLDLALEIMPDLIVTDIMMPGVSGVDMIEALRRQPEMEEIPVLVLSAKADEKLKIKLLQHGAQDFITKPFSEAELLARVRNLMAIRKSGEALLASEASKRQAIEAANRDLQIRSRQLNVLFEQAPSFMALLRGPQYVFELANKAYIALIGNRYILGKPLLEALPELKGQGFNEMLDQVLATGNPATGTGIPVRLQREPGGPLEERFVDFVYQPLLGNDDTVEGVFVEGHDVTDQKRAENALRMADRRKDEFLATLAHELRNPLAPIRHATTISQSPNASAAELRKSNEVIVRQVEHMGRLLDDLLDVSRITSGKLELRKEQLSVTGSLRAVVETVRPLIEARGHTLIVQVPETPTAVDADPVRFEQIFSNLLTNAAKYTDRGGTIAVAATPGNNTVTVTITDTGIGMAPEQLPRLFEMFSQATAAIDRSEGGLGIGLALVHGLVLLHGGTISASSPGPGLGSAFTVSLPLASVGRPLAPETVSAPVSNMQEQPRLRVLVVDDNRDNADLCTILFKKAGHAVRTAYQGADGLVLANQFRPHFIMLDIGMPGLNGYEVANQIRAEEWGKSMVLVAVTGWGQEDDKELARRAGFDHHVTKPFDFNILRQLVSQCVVTD